MTVVPVRKSKRVVAPLSPMQMEAKSQDELARLVGRLSRQGKTAEEIKEWFVENLPVAMRVASVRRR